MHPNNIGNDQHDDNPIKHPSSNHDGGDGFFRNANGCNFYQSKFTLVQGNMTTISGPQQPPWNTYRWVDFDQRTFRYISTSPTGVVTMAVEPMLLNSRVEVYHVHLYGEKKDTFDNHLEFVNSPMGRRPDVSQFLGTSAVDSDDGRFIVLAGGRSLSEVFTENYMDLKMRKKAYLLQVIDIFTTCPFTPVNWNWSTFWNLPICAPNYQLCVDMLLLESYGLVVCNKLGGRMACRKRYDKEDDTLTGGVKGISHLSRDLVIPEQAIKRCRKVLKDMFFDLALFFDLAFDMAEFEWATDLDAVLLFAVWLFDETAIEWVEEWAFVWSSDIANTHQTAHIEEYEEKADEKPPPKKTTSRAMSLPNMSTIQHILKRKRNKTVHGLADWLPSLASVGHNNLKRNNTISYSSAPLMPTAQVEQQQQSVATNSTAVFSSPVSEFNPMSTPQGHNGTPPTQWSVKQVVDWLKSKGFDQDICDKFAGENRITTFSAYHQNINSIVSFSQTGEEITGEVLLELDNDAVDFYSHSLYSENKFMIDTG